MLLKDFYSLFFPECCQACETRLVQGEELICTACIRALPRTFYHRFQHNPLFIRMYNRASVQHAFAFLRFEKGALAQRLLHAMKYRNKPEIGIRLGAVYGYELREAGFSFDAIVPVPLHRAKQRSRGFNQSAMFAKGLSQQLGIPVIENALIRNYKTATQTHKGKLNRWSNVKDVFIVNPDWAASENSNLLLVDDVVTTGATMEACVSALGHKQAGHVSIACIAVTP